MKRSPLRKRSKEYGKELDRYYKETKPSWLKAHPTCEFTVCYDIPCGSNWLPQIHHKMRRRKFLNDTRYFITVCNDHHDWIENNKKKARELGYILYK